MASELVFMLQAQLSSHHAAFRQKFQKYFHHVNVQLKTCTGFPIACRTKFTHLSSLPVCDVTEGIDHVIVTFRFAEPTTVTVHIKLD